MENKNYFQIIDMNVNRACEGSRVVEDYARVFGWQKIATSLKKIRHTLRNIYKNFDQMMIWSRKNKEDEKQNQLFSYHSSEINLFLANFKRMSEATRVLEEFSRCSKKSVNPLELLKLRYLIYETEKMFLKQYYQTILYTSLHPILNKNNIETTKKLIDAGYRIIQYRNKQASLTVKSKEIKEIASLCTENNVLLIVNDNYEIAFENNIFAIHLGQKDLIDVQNIEKLREKFLLIGISCHKEKDIENAIKFGADYIGLGAVLKTKNKKDSSVVGLKNAVTLYNKYISEIPIFLIGGINKEILKRIRREIPTLKTFAGISIFTENENFISQKRKVEKILKKEF